MSEAADIENPARYALFKALFLRSEGRSQVEAHRLIDAYAHELAEQVRAEKGSGSYAPGVYFHGGMDYAADIIDPHASAGPARPDEEPTT